MYEPLLKALESGATVVTANNRLSRSLARAYGLARQEAGESAWRSPDVLSWDAWLKRQWAALRLTDQRGDRRLISETQATVLWERVIRDSGLFDEDLASAASFAAAAWKLVCHWEVQDADEWTRAGLSPDQQGFLRWTGDFAARCRQLGLVDPARLPALLCEDAKQGLLDTEQSLIFAGFDTWMPVAERLRDLLRDRGVNIQLAAGSSRTQGEVRFAAGSDQTELETAARWARAQVEARPDAAVAVVVRDLDARSAEVRRIFMDVFCPDWRTREVTELPVNFSYGEPLSNKPRVAAALNILQLTLPGSDYRHFSLVLRTPFVHAGREEAGKRAALDLSLRDKLGAYFGPGEALPLAKHGAPEFARLLEKLPDPGRNKRPPREWAGWIAEVLRALGWPGDDSLDSIAYQEIESWNDLLRDFASADGLQTSFSWPEALGLLARLARSRIYQPETGPGVIQVMGFLEAAGHEFDHLWVTGLNAEDWPEARMPNPLLPAALQRRLQMPGGDPAAELTYAAGITERLRASAEHVVLSWPDRRDGEALRVSELIADVACVAEIPVWDAPLWSTAMLATAPVETLENDAPVEWEKGRQAKGGARLFGLQAECPLRAFLELRLGATEVERPLIGIGFKDRGSLAHEVLDEFYARYQDSMAIRTLNEAKLDSELESLVRNKLHLLPGMGRRYMRVMANLEAERLIPQLRQFVRMDAERPDFRVVEREQEREISVGPVGLRLRLDRLDEIRDQGRLVIDYKTGAVKRGTWNPQSPGDMQLPLYATYTDPGIRGVAFAEISANRIAYDGIAAEEIELNGLVAPAEMGAGKFRDGEGEVIAAWEDLIQEWADVLRELADDFAAGNCRINPKRPAKAEGQFAVLTRICELVRTEEERDDG
jgi:probable DNA repair protein